MIAVWEVRRAIAARLLALSGWQESIASWDHPAPYEGIDSAPARSFAVGVPSHSSMRSTRQRPSSGDLVESDVRVRLNWRFERRLQAESLDRAHIDAGDIRNHLLARSDSPAWPGEMSIQWLSQDGPDAIGDFLVATQTYSVRHLIPLS